MKIFRQFFILIKPFWRPSEAIFCGVFLCLILAMIYSLVNIQVWLNDWNNDFYNALSELNKDKLMGLMLWFLTILAILIFISVNKTWLIKLLIIRWRTWLTDYYLKKWLNHKRYYYL